MPTNYTPEQQAAVDFRKKRLLLSAAAGSGKTRVLVGRVIERIEHEKLDLEDFLIITFTRAAAAELRDRFAKALSERAAETGDRHLARQITASKRGITTIDSLCSMLIRENAHLSSVAGRRIVSAGELEKMRKTARSAALERIYSDESSDISALRESTAYGRSDKRLCAAVEQMYDHIREHPFPDAWCDELLREYASGDFGATRFGAELSSSVLRSLLGGKQLLELAKKTLQPNNKLFEAYSPVLDDDLSRINIAIAALNSNDLSGAYHILLPTDKRLPTVKGATGDPLKLRMQDLRGEWKEIKKRLLKLIAAPESYTDELAAALPAMRGLIRAANIFGEELERVKELRRAAEFSDYAHAAVELLAERSEDGSIVPSAIAESFGSRYREILVDEFQDTSELQTMICDLLSAGDGRSLFMVGDVKQSIYRFRLARPEIFLDRLTSYPSASDGDENARLELTQNFRSRTEILDAANYIFRRTMAGGASEIVYDDAQRLNPGRAEPYDPAFATELCVVGVPAGTSSAEAYAAEAVYVASRIREMLDAAPFLPEGDALRAARPDDFAVLLRATKGKAWLYRQALENLGIRCASGGESGVSSELLCLMSVLAAVDNPYLDVPLVGAMLSPAFGFSADELAQIRAAAPGVRSFYDAVRINARSGDAKTTEFIEKLTTFRKNAGRMSADKFILYLYAETPIVGAFSALEGGSARRERLNLAYLKARAYAKESRYGLHGFVEYLEGAIERGEIASEGGGSGVTITSIHKSKGLEFPIVFVSALAAQFNAEDTRGDILLHPTLGAAMKVYDRARHYVYPSGATIAIGERIRRESLAEELRILYVAMTRAREKLILTCAFADSAKKLGGILASGWLGEASFAGAVSPAEWLLPLVCEHPDGADLRTIAGSSTVDAAAEGHFKVKFIELEPSGTAAHGAADLTADAAVDETLIARIAQNLEFSYPAEGLSAVPSKLTATQLKGLRAERELDEADDSLDGYEADPSEDEQPSEPTRRYFNFTAKRPRLVARDRALTPTERGTALHTVMQFARYKALRSRESASDEVARLLSLGFITPEQAEAATREVDKLVAFAESELCRRALASIDLRREFKFSILEPAERYFPNAPSGEKVLLQGVCDLFFEEDGALVVVDLKSDRVTPSTERSVADGYAPQLDAYGRALARIFGKPVRERLIYFFATGHTVAVDAL